MASNHVSPYVQDGIAGFRVVFRHFLPNNDEVKSNSVTTLRFPICDGVTAEQAWESAYRAGRSAYREHFTGPTPKMPDIDWKAMGQTRTVSEKAFYQEKTEQAEKMHRQGYSLRRIAAELGVGLSTVSRWKKLWS